MPSMALSLVLPMPYFQHRLGRMNTRETLDNFDDILF